jgi:hypothetical protein
LSLERSKDADESMQSQQSEDPVFSDDDIELAITLSDMGRVYIVGIHSIRLLVF